MLKEKAKATVVIRNFIREEDWFLWSPVLPAVAKLLSVAVYKIDY